MLTDKPVKVKSFNNGRSAPILQIYVTNKSTYVGGVLENEKGKTTTIVTQQKPKYLGGGTISK